MKVKKLAYKMQTTIAICIIVSLCLMIMSAILIATLILKEKIQIESIDYLCKSTLAIVIFLGVIISKLLSPNEYIPTALIYTGAMIVLYFAAALFLGSSVTKVLLNIMFIICGAGSALLIGNKKRKKNIKIKKRYR